MIVAIFWLVKNLMVAQLLLNANGLSTAGYEMPTATADRPVRMAGAPGNC
jgi:hypothetical protein